MTTREPGASDALTRGSTVRPRSTAFFASRPAASITLGFEVLVQDVIAAMSTSPWPTSTLTGDGTVALTRSGVGWLFAISASVQALVFFAIDFASSTGFWLPPPASGRPRTAGKALAERRGLLAVSALGDGLRQEVAEAPLELGQRDPVLRPLRARDARLHAREVERELLGVVAVALAGHAEQPLRREVVPEGVDVLLAAPRREQVLAGFLVGREEAHRRAVLGRHVGDRRAIGQRERRGALAEKLDELADDAGAAQHLRHREHEVRRGDALGEPAREVDADDVGRQEVDGLAEHAGLRLDAARRPSRRRRAR